MHLLRQTASLLMVAVCLTAGVAGAQTVRGKITAETDGGAVVGARVVLLSVGGGSLAAVTSDSEGLFELELAPGIYAMRILRLGHPPVLTSAFEVPKTTRLMDLTVVVPASADDPYALAPLVVEGTAPLPHLASFYRHRAIGLGDFVTRDEFEEWNPAEVTDVVRRMPSYVVRANPTYGWRRPDGTLDTRRYRIEVATRSRRRNQECPVLLYLDGAFMGNTLTTDVEVIPISAVEAVETYSRPAQMPPEYNRLGSDCGVIAFWTRGPELRTGVSAAEFGVRWGGDISGGRLARGRLGVHYAWRLGGPVEFYPAFHYGLKAGDGWQAQLALRLGPMAGRFPWYVGTGLLAAKPTALYASVPLDAPRIEVSHTVFTGLALRVGPIRPFLEGHLIDLLAFSGFRGLVFSGVGVRF